MDKIKDYIGRLGEKLFPNLPEKKRNRITVQIIVGTTVSLICIIGMGIFRYRAVKQLEEYQAIADAYTQLNAALEYRREKEQELAVAELEEIEYVEKPKRFFYEATSKGIGKNFKYYRCSFFSKSNSYR